MTDTHFLAYAAVAALLVLSPGATMVVVADAGIEAGRSAALWTVAGIGTANATLALASAFGLAALVHRAPVVLTVMTVVGVAYLAWLGARALVRAVRSRAVAEPVPSGIGAEQARSLRETIDDPRLASSDAARFARGLVTNYSNASVVLFYTMLVPQFIGARDRFLPTFLLLGAIHVAMSVVWQGIVGLSVGAFAEKMTRPPVRRVMDVVMGVALLAFAVKIALS